MSNSRIVGTLTSSTALHSIHPLSERGESTVNVSRHTISRILSGVEKKTLLIIGPCSADFEDSLLEYGDFIRRMRETYGKEGIEIVMRYYTGKPRTIGGWKGLSNSQPGEDADTNIGLAESRRIALELLDMGIPLADEMLHPQLVRHFEDIYSYLAVGARSTENQYHREVASGLDIPVGMKNPTSGDIKTMLNSIEAGQSPSHYTLGSHVIDSTGNPLVHGILRGGEGGPNYSIEYLQQVGVELQRRKGKIQHPSIIIDASHDNIKINGKKDPLQQIKVVQDVVQNILPRLGDESSLVKGYMVESYLETGRQDWSENALHGLSLTDPCIGLQETEELIGFLAQNATHRYKEEEQQQLWAYSAALDDAIATDTDPNYSSQK